jgi:hypothetical protein
MWKTSNSSPPLEVIRSASMQAPRRRSTTARAHRWLPRRRERVREVRPLARYFALRPQGPNDRLQQANGSWGEHPWHAEPCRPQHAVVVTAGATGPACESCSRSARSAGRVLRGRVPRRCERTPRPRAAFAWPLSLLHFRVFRLFRGSSASSTTDSPGLVTNRANHETHE